MSETPAKRPPLSPEEKAARRSQKRPGKKKVCQFCVEKATSIDYKDAAKLRKFITEKGKILPRRTSGVCAEHQRALNTAVKRARQVALLPFKAE
jgi:small subunit ribosomal protein S18